MYGMRDLKEHIEVTGREVECPVEGCRQSVVRQKKRFRAKNKYRCPDHGIYISPSTFEYENKLDNLLWKDKDDLELLRRINLVKRESRMARDNSEDALSWNVFRFLERNNLVGSVLGSAIGVHLESPEVIYWSYSPVERCGWKELDRARIEFGEEISRSSEPDIIVVSDGALVFIEAKLKAGNETTPSNPEKRKRYESGGSGWFNQVFSSSYEEVAIESKKYELMRFWLLGTWIAEQLGLDFYLVNLVLDGRENEIVQQFNEHINANGHRQFMRLTWEKLYEEIESCDTPSGEKARELKYLDNKSLGYNKGQLEKALSLP